MESHIGKSGLNTFVQAESDLIPVNQDIDLTEHQLDQAFDNQEMMDQTEMVEASQIECKDNQTIRTPSENKLDDPQQNAAKTSLLGGSEFFGNFLDKQEDSEEQSLQSVSGDSEYFTDEKSGEQSIQWSGEICSMIFFSFTEYSEIELIRNRDTEQIDMLAPSISSVGIEPMNALAVVGRLPRSKIQPLTNSLQPKKRNRSPNQNTRGELIVIKNLKKVKFEHEPEAEHPKPQPKGSKLRKPAKKAVKLPVEPTRRSARIASKAFVETLKNVTEQIKNVTAMLNKRSEVKKQVGKAPTTGKPKQAPKRRAPAKKPKHRQMNKKALQPTKPPGKARKPRKAAKQSNRN